MARRKELILGVLAALVIGCSEPTSSSDRVASSRGGSLDGKGLAGVSLSITVSNVDSLGNPYGVTNDGQGAYVDGVQNVQAAIDQYGNLAFNTFTAKRGPATRWVNYDFTHPVDPTNTFDPAQDHTENYHFSTGPSTFSPWIALQNLGVGGNPATECGYMGNSFSANASTAYRVSYHKGNEDVQNSPTAFAVFTRVSVSPAVWTVTPVGSCSPSSNVAALRSNDGTVLYGYYTIPFFFTLTAR